jgi:hypothetical protein
LWLAGGGRGRSVSTYVLGTFYIRFFVYQGYNIWKNIKANCKAVIFLLRYALQKTVSAFAPSFFVSYLLFVNRFCQKVQFCCPDTQINLQNDQFFFCRSVTPRIGFSVDSDLHEI